MFVYKSVNTRFGRGRVRGRGVERSRSYQDALNEQVGVEIAAAVQGNAHMLLQLADKPPRRPQRSGAAVAAAAAAAAAPL